MQMRSSDENSVCVSVCLSAKRVNCDKTEERSVQILYHTNAWIGLVKSWWTWPGLGPEA